MPARLIVTNFRDGYFDAISKDYKGSTSADPNIRWRKNAIEIDYTYNDFLEKYRDFQGLLRQGTGKTGRDDMMEAFATDSYKKEQAAQLEKTRDSFRDFDYQPEPDAGLDPNTDTQQGAIKKVMAVGEGVCVGGGHSDKGSKEMLCDLMDDDTFGDEDVGMLFIEEFKTWAQPLLDEYLKPGGSTDMPPELEKYLDGVDSGIWKLDVPPKGFKTVVQKAKAKGLRIYGVDSGEADPGVNNESALHPERRVALMNKTAEEVMKKAKAENPGKKFVAMLGSAHSNSHEGGIPGLAQIFNVPAVTFDGTTKRFEKHPDDPANHRMPSKEEQAFIDKFIAKIEKEQGGPISEVADPNFPNKPYDLEYKEKMRNFVRETAKKLKEDGRLDDAKAVDKTLEAKDIVESVKKRAEYNKDRAGLRNATDKGQILAKYANDNDKEKTQELLDIDAGGASAIVVQMAKNGWHGLVNEALTKGADPTTAGKSWQELAYQTAYARNDAESFEQANNVQAMIDKVGTDPKTGGIDLDVITGDGLEGKSLVHLAAWNGNVSLLDKLDTAGADMTKKDGRGWTASQIAMTADKPVAEKFFYDRNFDAPASLLPTDGTKLSTVDMLMNATLTEHPGQRDDMRKMYESLYSNPALRPVLDLAALDSTRPRDPSGLGGMRIIAAMETDVCGLYHGQRDPGLRGAYADENHVMMTTCLKGVDSSGTLMHELTHAATRLVFGDDTIPAKDGSEAMTKYKEAIEKDVKNVHLLNCTDPVENEFNRTLASRMGSYARGAKGQGKEADTKLLQEFIVGVPQLIADYGEDLVNRCAPNLLGFYKSFNDEVKNKMTTDDRYKDAVAKLDNTALDVKLKDRVKKPVDADSRVNVTKDSFTLQSIQRKMGEEFRVRNGKLDPSTISGGTIAYSADNYKLTKEQRKQLANGQKALKKAWPTIAKNGLPPSLSYEDMGVLVRGLGESAGKDPKELKGAINKSLNKFSRSAKQSFVKHQIDKKLPVTDAQLAEAIVLRAEDKVFETYPQDTDNEAELEFSSKKHAELVKDLTSKLGQFPEDKKKTPGDLLVKLGDGVASGNSLAFYKKEKDVKKGSGHVSIDTKAAKRVWLSKLAQLKKAA